MGPPCGHRIPASNSLPASHWAKLAFEDRKLESDAGFVGLGWVSGVPGPRWGKGVGSTASARDLAGAPLPGQLRAGRARLVLPGLAEPLPLTRSFLRVVSIFQAWWGPHGLCGLALPLWGIQRLHSVNANGSCHMGLGRCLATRLPVPLPPLLHQLAGGGLQLATFTVGKLNFQSHHSSCPCTLTSPRLPGSGPQRN